MIMSFWPTSLRVEENKKKGASEHKAEQGERGKENRRREEGASSEQNKGEQTNASPLEKQDNRRRGRRRSRNRRWGGGHLCCRKLLLAHTVTFSFLVFLLFFHPHRIWDSKVSFEVRGKTHRAKEQADGGRWKDGGSGGGGGECSSL